MGVPRSVTVCQHPENSLQWFTTNHGRTAVRCRDCGTVSIEGEPLWLALVKAIIRRVRRRRA